MVTILHIVAGILLLAIAGCGSSRPKSLTSEDTETLGRGQLIGSTIGNYIDVIGRPERVFIQRHRDSVLGLQGWVAIPDDKTKQWTHAILESGFQERECLLVGQIRIKDDADRTWPILAAALMTAGAGVYAITQEEESYQPLPGTSGGDNPLGESRKDLDEWNRRRMEAEIPLSSESTGPLFRTWMYALGDEVIAYNFPALDNLGVIRSYAINRDAIPPVADTLLRSLVGD